MPTDPGVTAARDAAPGARVAIVTGAAGALGTAMCERFVRDGIRIVVADVALEPAEVHARRLDPSGGEALAFEVAERGILVNAITPRLHLDPQLVSPAGGRSRMTSGGATRSGV